MKTAISVPDKTFERASTRASELGMSRSELFSRAVDRYLDELDDVSLTSQIDQVIGARCGVDESSTDAVDIAHRLLAERHDEW